MPMFRQPSLHTKDLHTKQHAISANVHTKLHAMAGLMQDLSAQKGPAHQAARNKTDVHTKLQDKTNMFAHPCTPSSMTLSRNFF